MEFKKDIFFLIVCLFQIGATTTDNSGMFNSDSLNTHANGQYELQRNNFIIPINFDNSNKDDQPTEAPSFVVNNTVASTNKEVTYNETIFQEQVNVPIIIDHIHIQSNIRNRFAYTAIISKVRNNANTTKEAVFSVILPKLAFISNFVMEVDGQNYTAYVKEKEEAQQIYNEAVASGFGAAHVAVSARDSNKFTVSVNVQSGKKASFYITYEQLLQRIDGRYEQIININPGQRVKDLNVEVFINESRKITDLKVPQLRSGNEIEDENVELDPRADIQMLNETVAQVRFSPTWERQKQLAKLLNTEEDNGFSGQFVVQYDVERDPNGGEVLIRDGYFVHFFAPSELQSLPKHIIFVLDTSGSMENQRIRQLKQAMHNILEELNSNDLFHLVEFNSKVKVWNLDNSSYAISRVPLNKHIEDPSYLPNAYLANTDNIKKAKSAVSNFDAFGFTDIMEALSAALRLVYLASQKPVNNVHREPIILFLTDGEPTVGETSTEQIIKRLSEFNIGSKKASIYSLSFGEGADKKFLKKLSIKNSGFSKHIYEAADASLQLQDFYQQISSPLLANVQFKYEPSVTSLTLTEFPLHFRGSEIVIAGRCGPNFFNSSEVDGIASTGPLSFKPTIGRAISSTERLWAYLTIQQLLEKKESSDGDMELLKRRALDLSIKYSFVTPLSSLVVVKPNETNTVNIEDASAAHPTNIPVQNNNINNNNNKYASGAQPTNFPVRNNNNNQKLNINTITRGRPHINTDTAHRGFINLNINQHANGEHHRNNHILQIPIFSNFDNSNKDDQPKPPQNPLQDLLVQLPWLNKLLDENNKVKLPTGNYELGLHETIRSTEACANARGLGVGRCALLKNCPTIFTNITSSLLYMQSRCIVEGQYAGICCPTSCLLF